TGVQTCALPIWALLDDAAADPTSGVSGGLRHEVIGFLVDDDGPAKYRVGPLQGELARLNHQRAAAVGAHGHVPEIPRVVLFRVGGAVHVSSGIEVAAGGRGIGSAAVPLLVDMNRVGPGDSALDAHRDHHLGAVHHELR